MRRTELATILVAWLAMACALALEGCAAPSRMGARSATACIDLQHVPRASYERPGGTSLGGSICIGFE